MAGCRQLLLVVVLLYLNVDRGVSQLTGDNVQYRPGECLPGDNHKELTCPEPEGPEYEYCFQWSEETCCTAEFTKQLAAATVTNIDGFHWNRCGPLSTQCEEYFKRVECFYRCSPHVAHWRLDPFPSALANLPVCHEFCDEWFNACASDMTCAVNWISDWDYVNGMNQCKLGATCRNFSDVYTDGRGICETLWGASFIYSNYSQDDSDRQCMTFWWPQNQANPNQVAIDNLFGELVNTTQPAPCEGDRNTTQPAGGGASGHIPHIFPLLAIAFLLTVFGQWL